MAVNQAARSGFAVWFTGLPASGKTSIARRLCQILSEQSVTIVLLDSDELRKVLTPHPRYTDDERDWFYSVVVYLAEHLTESGVNVAISATAPRRFYRATARLHIEKFAEVYVDCPEALCRERDPKGLWRKADSGEIKTLPGFGVPYEKPSSPEIHIETAQTSVSNGASRVLKGLEKLGFLAKGFGKGKTRSFDGKVIFL
ncbi:MAG: adenylyl-sulfate kinase [Syntrophorhabdaceae bacterium]|nr:adenylyl-sulfate kinase [Syntrophorhabdaceae bacterium]MDD4195248.1 adenylyl-sulfate kinase [Syntrophorhabdaceae bacterium]